MNFIEIKGTVRRKLMYLVVLATLPMFGALLWINIQQRNNDVRIAESETEIFVRGFSEVQERTTDSTRNLLRTVSAMSEIRNGDAEGARRVLSTLLKANPIYTNVILVDAKGDVVAMGKGKNKGFNFADRKQFKDAMRTGKFSHGEYVVGKASNKSIFPFGMPVFDENGKPNGAIIIGVNLGHYKELFEKAALPKGAFMGLSDHKGIRLFRYPYLDDDSIGVPIRQAVFEAAHKAQAPGSVHAKATDGLDRIVAFEPIRLTPDSPPYMYMFVGLDRAQVLEQADRQLFNSVIVSAFSLCLALSMAWILGWRTIVSQLERLTYAARKLGEGKDVSSGVDYEDGEIGQLAHTFDDMAMLLRKRENDLHDAKEAAESANMAKDEFLANISHEVRTPLNGVMGMLQLLRETRVDSEQQSFLSTALHSSRNLLRVLNDLLDFIKVGAGKLELFEEPFELEELVRQSVDLFRLQVEEKDIVLKYHISEAAEGQYMGDVGRIRQILFNLIGNAIKFTESGSIEVQVFTLPHPSEDRVRLFFSIEDSGIGIPDDKIECIFDAFTQVDGSLSRGHQGTGLGLPIVKKLVNLMGGTCVIESELGSGTNVMFCVLVVKVTPLSSGIYQERVVASNGPLNILLVEDEKVNRVMAQRLLEKMGHHVICAENGEEGLARLDEGDFDLVFMDIQMPVMDGLEAVRRIRTDAKYAHLADIPIVALSAHAAEEHIRKAREVGMNDYVTKPFEKATLEELLATIVRRSRDS
ncbi:hybrid sensor histidine kinase/response regulator [Pseudodesulfovibrio sp. zrk46]|uniref:hybrid sensor histidine kinase/response regulator n=1 Tax=Pseudodesulfovibrio sp. zrk46 TaxID=2725288 RepID=UPI001448BE56|nr:hybrid sensor histidine kinase/response regulator [Pseudodesulfovibrio sp. zrk46]QJB56907.1 response regulator [Pseudodesulfovibrio sp. zrk46]